MKSAYLLELLDSTLVDSTALVDQVCKDCESFCSGWWQTKTLTTSGGRFAGVDVANDHDVDVHLLFTRRGVSSMFCCANLETMKVLATLSTDAESIDESTTRIFISVDRRTPCLRYCSVDSLKMVFLVNREGYSDFTADRVKV